jgi:hypothetical protein
MLDNYKEKESDYNEKLGSKSRCSGTGPLILERIPTLSTEDGTEMIFKIPKKSERHISCTEKDILKESNEELFKCPYHKCGKWYDSGHKLNSHIAYFFVFF